MTTTVSKERLKRVVADLKKAKTQTQQKAAQATKRGEHSVAFAQKSKGSGIEIAILALQELVE